jgi:hypothetical protein
MASSIAVALIEVGRSMFLMQWRYLRGRVFFPFFSSFCKLPPVRLYDLAVLITPQAEARATGGAEAASSAPTDQNQNDVGVESGPLPEAVDDDDQAYGHALF